MVSAQVSAQVSSSCQQSQSRSFRLHRLRGKLWVLLDIFVSLAVSAGSGHQEIIKKVHSHNRGMEAAKATDRFVWVSNSDWCQCRRANGIDRALIKSKRRFQSLLYKILQDIWWAPLLQRSAQPFVLSCKEMLQGLTALRLITGERLELRMKRVTVSCPSQSEPTTSKGAQPTPSSCPRLQQQA